jgi:hypothetical protein
MGVWLPPFSLHLSSSTFLHNPATSLTVHLPVVSPGKLLFGGELSREAFLAYEIDYEGCPSQPNKPYVVLLRFSPQGFPQFVS